jgi:hypothetical protein
MHVIEPSIIYRPAILMPCCDKSNGFNAGSFNYHRARNLRLWIIPYRSVDVNGYDIGDVDEPELVEMESTFTEMNASMERIVQNEEGNDGKLIMSNIIYIWNNFSCLVS